MSRTHIPTSLRQLVSDRASGRCEYCLVHDDDVLLPHEPDHIIAEQHGGKAEAENLALACVHCNRRKGPNIASLGPRSGELVPLFNPRAHAWTDHFSLDGPYIRPLTEIGEATVQLLKLNDPDRVRVREALIEADTYP